MRGIGDKEDGGGRQGEREEVTQDQKLELNHSVRCSGGNLQCGLQTSVTNTAGKSQCESLVSTPHVQKENKHFSSSG